MKGDYSDMLLADVDGGRLTKNEERLTGPVSAILQ
jgi:hypothetical protein